MDKLSPAVVPLPAALRRLFPVGTSIAWSATPPASGSLLPVEQPATRAMAPTRRQAFVQGRACAHQALLQLGCNEVAVPVGEQRAPLWPPGIAGSIAHCTGHAIAVAARQEVANSIGVDLEEIGDLETGVLRLVCTAAERDWLAGTGGPRLARTLFAIKESVYKCLWPQVRRFIDFQEVEIELDPASGRYRARAMNRDLDANTVASIRGACVQINGLLCASAYLPPAPAL